MHCNKQHVCLKEYSFFFISKVIHFCVSIFLVIASTGYDNAVLASLRVYGRSDMLVFIAACKAIYVIGKYSGKNYVSLNL